nr:histidine kinase-like ATPase, C-terminal domain-containing protein [Tanacetum cinerariifolium]
MVYVSTEELLEDIQQKCKCDDLSMKTIPTRNLKSRLLIVFKVRVNEEKEATSSSLSKQFWKAGDYKSCGNNRNTVALPGY